MVLGAVALWPRGSQLEAEVAPEAAPLPDLPPPVRVDAPPPVVRMAFSVQPADKEARRVCINALTHMGTAYWTHDVVRELGQEELGLPRLVATTVPFRRAPRRSVRRALTVLGLRPATVGGWLVDAWPRAAAAGLVAEERWATAEWKEALDIAQRRFAERFGHDDPYSPRTSEERRAWRQMAPDSESETIRSVASQLVHDEDPWVRQIASVHYADQVEIEEAQRWALDALADDPSPSMLSFAANLLQVPHIELTADDEALLRRLVHEHPEHAEVLARYAARHSFEREGCTDRWLPELEIGLRNAPDEWSRQAMTISIETVRGQLAARGQGPVESWQSGLVVAAYECSVRATSRVKVRGAGTYDGAWRWEWATDDAVTRCLSSIEVPGPRPPDGQRVEVDIDIGRSRG